MIRLIFVFTIICKISLFAQVKEFSLERSFENFLLNHYLTSSVEINTFDLKFNQNEKKRFFNQIEKKSTPGFLEVKYNEFRGLYDSHNETESDSVVAKMLFLKKDNNGVSRYFYYKSKDFVFDFRPIIAATISDKGSERFTHYRSGVYVQGSYLKNFFFGLTFYDNNLAGKNSFERNQFSEEQRYVWVKTTKNGIEFDNVEGYFSYEWGSGSLSLDKSNEKWGHGNSGKLILSNRAPSFTKIKLKINPVDWLDFTYFHGWLHSSVLDSNSIRNNIVPGRQSSRDVKKFIAAHYLTIKPTSDLNITLGESVIYSDEINMMYFVPILFFRIADHYTQKEKSNTGNNAQIYADIAYRVQPIKTQFYGTLFIDELSLNSVLKGEEGPSAVGYTFGLNSILPHLEGILNFEYTRINPFVYRNSNDAEVYQNRGEVLGHWIGDNADRYLIKYSKNLFRINLAGKIEMIRKGSQYTPEDQYTAPSPKFLSGGFSRLTTFDLELVYEVLTSLNIGVNYIHRFISTGIFNEKYFLTGKDFYSLSLSYGL